MFGYFLYLKFLQFCKVAVFLGNCCSSCWNERIWNFHICPFLFTICQNVWKVDFLVPLHYSKPLFTDRLHNWYLHIMDRQDNICSFHLYDNRILPLYRPSALLFWCLNLRAYLKSTIFLQSHVTDGKTQLFHYTGYFTA